MKARQGEKRRPLKQGSLLQQPSSTKLPGDNTKLLIVNQHGPVAENPAQHSLRSSFDDDIDGRPGSLQPFKPRDSTQ